MNKPGQGNGFDGRLRVTIYKDRDLRSQIMLPQQLQFPFGGPDGSCNRGECSGSPIADPDEFDLYMDLVHSCIRVRKADRAVVIHRGRVKGIGPERFAMQRKLMRYPGRYLSPYELGRMNPQVISHYVKGCVIATTAKLRKHLFGENGRNPYFLLTTEPLRVAYNGDLTYVIIEPLQTEER